MKQILILLSIFLSIGLVGCQNETQTSKQSTSEQNAPLKKKMQEKPMKNNDWITESKAASILQEQGIKKPYHFLVDDLDQDGIPEVIADYGKYSEELSKKSRGFTIFHKQKDTNKWNISAQYKDVYSNDFHLYTTTETPSGQKLLVGTRTISSATMMTTALQLFSVDLQNNAVKEMATVNINDSDDTVHIKDENHRIEIQFTNTKGAVTGHEMFEWKGNDILRSSISTVFLTDWEHYFDGDFINKLRHHQLKGVPYPLGTNMLKIKKDLGSVYQEDYYRGAQFIKYQDLGILFCHLMNEKELISVVSNVEGKGLKFSDAERLLGKPNQSGVDEMDNVYNDIYYTDNGDILSLESRDANKSSGIAVIELKKKLD